MSHIERVLSHIDGRRDAIVDLMQRMIRARSVSGDESEMARLLAAECERDGLEVELFEPERNRTSVIARYAGTTGRPRVMVYSHIDTVPPGDLASWAHPPFSGDLADGFIWGRGAADNKAAACAEVMAFRALRELGIGLRGDVVFAHVADEERGGKLGFKRILEAGYGEGVDFLFYGHAGSREHVGVAANGSASIVIRVAGRAAHTQNLEEGVNAVGKAARLIVRLEELAAEVNARSYRLPGTDSVMRSRFSVNKCVGFVANNIVPDSCELVVDRRYTPAESLQAAEGEVRRVVERLRAEDPAFDAAVTAEPRMELSISPPDSEIVQSFQRAAEKVIGITPRPRGGSHSSDHGHFVVRHRRPVASYGIGGTGTHSANERIAVEDLILTTKVYALTLLDLLSAE